MSENKTSKGNIRLVIMGREIFSLNYAASISLGFVAIVGAIVTKILG